MGKILKYGFTLIVLLGIALTVFISMGEIPDSKAVKGKDLPSGALESLREAGIVSKSEKIHYFYSEDLFSFVDYGNFFTDTRVVSYEVDGETNQRNVYSANFEEITNIQHNSSESFLDDSIIEIFVDEQHSFNLVVSTEGNGDQRFYKKLVETWKSHAGA